VIARLRLPAALWRTVTILIALYAFVLGLSLMVEGAGALAPLVRALKIEGPVNSLGLGWLAAYVVLSGSPIAAMAMSLLGGGILGPLETYTMITGSRLGASLVVLVVGALYTLRGHEGRTSTYMGTLSIVVSGVTQLLALPIGVGLLLSGWMRAPTALQGNGLISLTDRLVGSLARLIAASAIEIGGSFLLFATGLAVIMAALWLFDRGLPQPKLAGTRVGQTERVLYRPGAMLLLGMGVTLLSLSVSVSLSLLVPLSARGYIRRENVIPYIMGANITTFVDTLFAAALVPEPMAVTVVLSHMTAVLLVAVILLGVAPQRFQRAMLALADLAAASRRNTMVFGLLICLIPVILMLL